MGSMPEECSALKPARPEERKQHAIECLDLPAKRDKAIAFLKYAKSKIKDHELIEKIDSALIDAGESLSMSSDSDERNC